MIIRLLVMTFYDSKFNYQESSKIAKQLFCSLIMI
jgi:hypothetical protein